jgi:hypothetical protein
MARLTRASVLGAGLLVSALLLSACGSDTALGQAKQACVYVAKAITEQRDADRLTAGPVQTRLANKALATLLRGEPLAAQATSNDGTWNPLMTAINEAQRVPFVTVIPSLSAICRAANSSLGLE